MDQTPEFRQQDRKTILVVDDDATVLALVSKVLAKSDHNILMASSGTEALQQSREFEGEIHVLVSDFQMPGMSGGDLATAMTVDRPGLKVLLMSGFPDGKLVLKEGWQFLSKPFVVSQLQALVAGLVSPAARSRFAMSFVCSTRDHIFEQFCAAVNDLHAITSKLLVPDPITTNAFQQAQSECEARKQLWVHHRSQHGC